MGPLFLAIIKISCLTGYKLLMSYSSHLTIGDLIMKKGSIAAAAALATGLFAAVATAGEQAVFDACTKDGKNVAIELHASGNATTGADVKATLQKLWNDTVSPLTLDELGSETGYKKFLENVKVAEDALKLTDDGQGEPPGIHPAGNPGLTEKACPAGP